MAYSNKKLQAVYDSIAAELKQNNYSGDVLRDKRLKEVFGEIKNLDNQAKAQFGQDFNSLKSDLKKLQNELSGDANELPDIDITAPAADNSAKPALIAANLGSTHPINQEIAKISAIFEKMGFSVHESRQLDNDYNMFEALNFPADHPARDDYDTFMTDEGLIPPAHTSTMQNRILRSNQPPIRAVIPGRTYRNEDVDATHEHTFHQIEGVYVDKNIALTDMLGVIKEFLSTYFEQDIEYKTQPFYFPFVEPGLEFLIKTPAGFGKDEWLEVMGCGMIHPNVLQEAGIDPEEYSGFAWGFGLDRMVMLKNKIEDVRHFHSGDLKFLRKF